MGQWESYQNTLGRLEGVFDESAGYGLNQVMSAFWNSWQDLSNNPGGQAERVALISQSETLATTFSQFREDIVRIQKDTDFSIELSVEEVNDLSAQIADLNQRIHQAEVVGQNANDYRDKRDLLLNDLAGLIDINAFEGDDGRVNVMTASGKPLVENNDSWTVATEPDGNGYHNVVWIDSSGGSVDITDQISGGNLKGWIDARDVAIPAYLDNLDTLAKNLIDEVNAVHSAGYGLTDPLTGLPYESVDFFSGTSADDMAVSATVAGDFRAVAASATQLGIPGDNDNAIRIANLQSALTMNGIPASSTFDEYYNTMISRLGSEVQRAEGQLQHQTDMVALLNNYRESTSGVSLDEEMVELVEYQHAYEAAARLITTVDEMMEVVLSLV